METIKLNPELRRRLPFLGHLPVHCDVTFLELDMAGFVSAETADKFHQGTRDLRLLFLLCDDVIVR